MVWPFLSRRERLRRDAADWIARLNSAEGDSHRAAFQRWYAQSPDHAEAYDRLAGLFRAAGGLARSRDISAQHGRAIPNAGIGKRGYAVAAALACAALLAFILLPAPTMRAPVEAQQQYASFAIDESAARQLVLRDGSRLLLSPGTRLDVAIGSDARRLRLLAGKGRFTVASEPRPFVVTAGPVEIVAHGTQFVVSLDQGRTTVTLIEGRVEVSYPGEAGQRRTTRLDPGQHLVVEGQPGTVGLGPVRPADAPPQPAMLQFDDLPLEEALAQANRHGGARIRLGDPTLARLRLTGAFLAADGEGFARAVAATFDLKLERAADGSLVLTSSDVQPLGQ